MTERTIHRDNSPDGKGRPHLTQIYAQETPDGGLRIHGFHASAAVEEWVGKDDYSFGLTLRKEDLPRALTALLADRFGATEPLTYTHLRALLEAEGLETEAAGF